MSVYNFDGRLKVTFGLQDLKAQGLDFGDFICIWVQEWHLAPINNLLLSPKLQEFWLVGNKLFKWLGLEDGD